MLGGDGRRVVEGATAHKWRSTTTCHQDRSPLPHTLAPCELATKKTRPFLFTVFCKIIINLQKFRKCVLSEITRPIAGQNGRNIAGII